MTDRITPALLTPALLTPALLTAALTTLALVAAPTADARPTCQSTDFKTICQTNGSVSIKARPGTTAPPANLPVFPWLGMPGAR